SPTPRARRGMSASADSSAIPDSKVISAETYARAGRAGQYAPSRPRLRLVFAALAGNEPAGAVHRARQRGDDSMLKTFTRRAALKTGAGGALAALLMRPLAALADDSIETHGLSSFGDLALPPDFPHFAYVNPQAPTGGLLSLQITGTSG